MLTFFYEYRAKKVFWVSKCSAMNNAFHVENNLPSIAILS